MAINEQYDLRCILSNHYFEADCGTKIFQSLPKIFWKSAASLKTGGRFHIMGIFNKYKALKIANVSPYHGYKINTFCIPLWCLISYDLWEALIFLAYLSFRISVNNWELEGNQFLKPCHRSDSNGMIVCLSSDFLTLCLNFKSIPRALSTFCMIISD